MEESGFEWIAEMRDGMSKPANMARESLQSLRGEMVNVDRELQRINRTQQQIERRRWGPLAEGGDLFQGAGARLVYMLGPLALIIGAVRMVREAFEAAVGAVKDFVIEGSKASILAVETQQHMLRTFTGGAEGNEEIGGQTFDMVMRLRRELPQSQKEIANWVSTLQGAGLIDPSGLVQTVKAMSAASALMGGGAQGDAAANKVKEIMARASEMGSFKIRGGLRGFVGTGISPDDLSKALGMTPAQLNVAFTKGTVPVERGMAAIEEILTTKGAKALEGTMREWDVIMAKGRESVSHLFDDVETGPFMETLRDTGDMLDKDQLQGRALNQIFKALFGETFDLGNSALINLRVGFTWLEVSALRAINAVRPLKPLLEVFEGMGGEFLREVNNAFALLTGLIERAARGLEIIHAIAGGELPTVNRQPIGFERDERAPAHASGGMVLKPAAGEYLASVAPGETILPADHSRAASPRELGDDGGGNSLAQHNVLHFHGVKGAEEAKDLMVDALADVLEQAALEVGR